MSIIRVEGGRAIVAELGVVSAEVGLEVGKIVRKATYDLQREIRKNASTGTHKPGAGHIPGTGPGPNVGTGNYRRSITASVRSSSGQFAGALGAGAGTIGRVTSNAPQAYRLEYGFVGTDSRGRTYHQSAFPHWGPAVEQIEPKFVADIEAALNRTLGDAT